MFSYTASAKNNLELNKVLWGVHDNKFTHSQIVRFVKTGKLLAGMQTLSLKCQEKL